MMLFSQKPSKGIKFFHEKGLVEDNTEAIAKFLHAESDRLDKTAIGELSFLNIILIKYGFNFFSLNVSRLCLKKI